jgi:hypothetical protein
MMDLTCDEFHLLVGNIHAIIAKAASVMGVEVKDATR